jgi:hypothetical protein
MSRIFYTFFGRDKSFQTSTELVLNVTSARATSFPVAVRSIGWDRSHEAGYCWSGTSVKPTRRELILPTVVGGRTVKGLLIEGLARV